MTLPTFTGVHHLKIPVTDVETSAAWFEKAFGARRVERFNHREKDGTLYAAMVMMPGVASPVELRHASKAAKAVAGYDPVTFGVKDKAALDHWVERLDAHGIKHTPVVTGYIGHVIGIDTPDGLALRVYTDPVGGFENVEFHPEQADINAPSLSTPLMERSLTCASGPEQECLHGREIGSTSVSGRAPIPLPSHKPTLSRPRDQPSWAVGTNTYTFIVTGEHTNNAFAFFDGIFPPGGHVGAHCHGYEEMLYVLEGELTVYCDDRRNVLGRNTALNISAWSPHELHNYSGKPVRIVVTTSPAELEKQFEEIGHRMPNRNSPPPELSKEEQERITKLMPLSSEQHLARVLPADTFAHFLSADQPA